MACHKQGLTNWKGGRGRGGLVSFKTWHITNEDSLTGAEEEGGAGWCALQCGTSQVRAKLVGSRKGEGRVGGVRNVAWCKVRTHLMGGRKWEEWVGELRSKAKYK